MLEVQGLHHVSLIVRDVAASQRFFCEVLGMEPASPPANFKFTVAWVRKGRAELHLVQAEDAVQAPGDKETWSRPDRDATFARHVCLQINSVEALVETLRAHQVPIVAGPRARGDGPSQTYIHDLDGHLIELVCLNPAH
ncbi:MAG: VOC family protein [Anaerolineales bacterium]|nr:VOC family protein [Anaerolineales bacterium]